MVVFLAIALVKYVTRFVQGKVLQLSNRFISQKYSYSIHANMNTVNNNHLVRRAVFSRVVPIVLL